MAVQEPFPFVPSESSANTRKVRPRFYPHSGALVFEYVRLLGPHHSSPFKGTDKESLHHSEDAKESGTVLTTNTFPGSSVRCRVLDRRGQERHADTTVAVELLATFCTREERRNTLERAVLSNKDSRASI